MNKEIITNSFEQRVDGQDRFKLSISGLGPTLVFDKFSITFGSAAMRFTFLSEEEEISDFKLSYSDFFLALDDAQKEADAAALKKRKLFPRLV